MNQWQGKFAPIVADSLIIFYLHVVLFSSEVEPPSNIPKVINAIGEIGFFLLK